ncbi:metallophosphoesterase [Arcticibacter eurypsychrophilus]|uniref:metallophosphoesterase n=1 Tax=Arcticibacter eurypsychrophilus TaxID=1434752 RepID=UPI001B8D457F|nr:metallophosphoesterase [Arcticibacter eurypsychrophilus]
MNPNHNRHVSRNTIKHISLIAGLILFSNINLFAQKFTIPIFPDTQGMVQSRHDMFFSELHWIAAKRDSLHIPFVLHVGDLVNFDNITHYETASKGFEILDSAKIPYVIALGNHDTEAVGVNSGSAAPGNVNLNLRKTTKFNHYFPTSRFTAQKGRFEKDKSDNSYYTFEVENTRWLVISLEFCAREDAAKWMDKVISKHPKYNTIILTHYHLTPKGEINTTNAGYGDMKSSDIFERYIKPHKNVLMVLSGHVCYSASRVDMGLKGNQIYQILQDYQNADSGGGYLRLLEIDVEKNTIMGKMYSPFYNKEIEGDESKVAFSDVKFIKKK